MDNLDGTWQVEVELGPWWFPTIIKFLRDIKRITGDKGYNIAWKTKYREFEAGIRWGKFTIYKRNERFYLVYENYPVIDIVQFVSKDKLSGRFYRNHKYVGTFTLTRVKP